MKRTIPLLISTITGFVLIVAFFIPYSQSWGDLVMDWFEILAAFAFVLGGANLLMNNLQKISDQKAGWGYSAVTVVAFLVTLVVGLGKIGVHPSEDFPAFAWSGDVSQEGSAFWWIFNYLYLPMNGTVFALLAFFVASAAFRAFRAKNAEALVLLLTATVVLMGRTYAGIFTTGWVDQLPGLMGWSESSFLAEAIRTLRLDRLTEVIMNSFTLPAMRAITIGIALGVVGTSLKVLLGIDRSFLGSDQE